MRRHHSTLVARPLACTLLLVGQCYLAVPASSKIIITADRGTAAACEQLVKERLTSNYAQVERSLLMNPVKGKGEFETTVQYEARLEAALWRARDTMVASSGLPFVFHSFGINYPRRDTSDAIEYRYDADSQILRLIYVRNEEPYPVRFNLDDTWSRRMSGTAGPVKTFAGQNAFGARATVTVSRDTERRWIFARIGQTRHGRDFVETKGLSFEVNIAPTDLQPTLPFYRILIAGQLIKPNIQTGIEMSGAPTIGNPHRWTVTSAGIEAPYVCAALYDVRTREVLSSQNITISELPDR